MEGKSSKRLTLSKKGITANKIIHNYSIKCITIQTDHNAYNLTHTFVSTYNHYRQALQRILHYIPHKTSINVTKKH